MVVCTLRPASGLRPVAVPFGRPSASTVTFVEPSIPRRYWS